VVLVSGFKKDYSSEEVLKLIPTHVASHVFDVRRYRDMLAMPSCIILCV